MEVKTGEVKAMVKKARTPLYKAVIGFLAQTGQRTGVLRGITWKMIDEDKVKAYGIASIPMELKDKKGVTVREGVFYRFVIGKDTMILLHDWTQTEKRKEQGTFVFGLSERHLHRIVAEAAKKAGVQEDSHGMPGRILYKVRPDAFPTYWNDRVRDSGMDKLQSKYMMGKDVSSEPRNRGLFQTDRLLLAYRKAEPMLDVF
jgi:integrase